MTQLGERGEAIFVGMGSNLGDRFAHLCDARDRLAALPGTSLVALSNIYESKAVGPGAQPRYLNAVASLRSQKAPRHFLKALLAIERDAGRVRGQANEARTLDLDLLLYGDRKIDEPGLLVPHPRIRERAFVLLPLAELAAGRSHPGTDQAFTTLAAGVSTAAWRFESLLAANFPF